MPATELWTARPLRPVRLYQGGRPRALPWATLAQEAAISFECMAARWASTIGWATGAGTSS